jgi:hypothetical protein
VRNWLTRQSGQLDPKKPHIASMHRNDPGPEEKGKTIGVIALGRCGKAHQPCLVERHLATAGPIQNRRRAKGLRQASGDTFSHSA